eukprot:SAG22_NODE_1212_length_5155_cov_2.020767_3_plen_59_part_00
MCVGVYIDTCSWTGGVCMGVFTILQVSPLTLGVYTTTVSIIFETGRPLLSQNASIPLY